MDSRGKFALSILAVAVWAQAAPAANPHVTVTLPGVGTWLFTDVESDLVAAEATAGSEVAFSWTADAGWYGGTIAGYRYGWDLIDPADPDDPGWASTGFLPDLLAADPRTFAVSTHTFHVKVVDTAGNGTLAGIVVHVANPLPLEAVGWGTLKSTYRSDRR